MTESVIQKFTTRYLEYIKPIRTQLDNILFEEQEPEIELAIEDDIIS